MNRRWLEGLGAAALNGLVTALAGALSQPGPLVFTKESLGQLGAAALVGALTGAGLYLRQPARNPEARDRWTDRRAVE